MLLLAHKFLAFFQAVRLALDVDNGAVMQDAVQDGGGDGDVGKDLVPLREGFVGGKDGRCFFIPSGNKLEEQVCALDVHGEVADLVDDEHPVLGENLELVRQTVLKVGLLSSALSVCRFGCPSTVLLSFSDSLSGLFLALIGSLSFSLHLRHKTTFFPRRFFTFYHWR